jgi:hypothetical protein
MTSSLGVSAASREQAASVAAMHRMVGFITDVEGVELS